MGECGDQQGRHPGVFQREVREERQVVPVALMDEIKAVTVPVHHLWTGEHDKRVGADGLQPFKHGVVIIDEDRSPRAAGKVELRVDVVVPGAVELEVLACDPREAG